MKTIKPIICAALATVAAASCSKEPISSAESQQEEMITVSFGTPTQTKTTNKDGSPLWSTGDRIWITDGHEHIDTVIVSSKDNGKKTFSFKKPSKFIGSRIYGVYPASCALGTVTGGKADIYVPSVQDGTFASANICSATTTTTSLSLENAAAILHIPQTFAGVHSVIIEASVGIAGESKSIYANALGKTDVYIAVEPVTLAASTTKFTYVAEEKYLTKEVVTGITLQKSDLINLPSLDDYDIAANGNDLWVQLWTGGTYWSVLNIGGSSHGSFGCYFSWGNTDGHWLNGVQDGIYMFDQYMYSTSPGSLLSGDIVPGGSNDAAHVLWGGSCRMPTATEISDLLFHVTSKQTSRSGKLGVLLSSTSNGNELFIPYAGHIAYNEHLAKGEYGSCSSVTKDFGPFVKCLSVSNDYYSTQGTFASVENIFRYYALPIRPVK